MTISPAFNSGGIFVVHPHCNNPAVSLQIAKESLEDLIVIIAHVICHENGGVPFHEQADGRNLNTTAECVANQIRKIRNVDVIVRPVIDLKEHDCDTIGQKTHKNSTYTWRNFLERARLAHRGGKIVLDPFYSTGDGMVYVVQAFIHARDLSMVPTWRRGVSRVTDLWVSR